MMERRRSFLVVTREADDDRFSQVARDGRVRYALKTPYRDGTTHVIFKPLDFMAKLAALVPKPRVHLTRFHGVFARNSHHRMTITPVLVECLRQRVAGA